MLKMDLDDAILVAMESMLNEIDGLEAKAKNCKRVNIDRVQRIRTLRTAYKLLDGEFDRRMDSAEATA